MKVAITEPSSAPRTVAVGVVPAKAAPPSMLAVTTIFSIPAGTAPVSTAIESGAEPPPERWVTPGPCGWL